MTSFLVQACSLALTVAGQAAPAAPPPSQASPPSQAAPAAPDSPAAPALPPGELGEVVKLGKQLFEETGTHPLTRAYVRNALSCASCHPDAGAHPTAATLVGAATAYPAWSPREDTAITLEDRVLNCFMRSMNGTRPPNGSRPSVAITAYLTWLSTSMPIHQNAESPLGPRSARKPVVERARVNVERGRALFRERCAVCHGEDGQGEGGQAPPVWGPRSFNAGAGLADVARLAGWLRVTMPPDDPLSSDADAVDVAAYIDAQPRPDFVLKDHLPPAGRAGTYNSKVLKQVIRAPTWPPRR